MKKHPIGIKKFGRAYRYSHAASIGFRVCSGRRKWFCGYNGRH